MKAHPIGSMDLLYLHWMGVDTTEMPDLRPNESDWLGFRLVPSIAQQVKD